MLRANVLNKLTPLSPYGLGILLSLALGLMAITVAKTSFFSSLGISALTIAIIAGMLIGNTVFPRFADTLSKGIDFSRSRLLRFGIVLFGFNVTIQQVMSIGMNGFMIDCLIVTLIFGTAYYIGTHWLKLDRDTTILIGAGSAICGAAAILATEPVIKAQAHKISVAVATVVIFGTLSMFIYPLIYPYLNMSEFDYGIFVGSTIHEVAQVVAAGDAISPDAANAAVIEKMMRVMLLVPFLLFISNFHRRKSLAVINEKSGISVPWFAVMFVIVIGINSLNVIPHSLVVAIKSTDVILLSMAMAALGVRTHIGAIKQAGVKPLVLASILFCLLLVFGYSVNILLE